MNAQTLQEIIALIALAGQAGTELYLKLRAIGELGPDEQANIHKEIADGIAFDEDVKKKCAQWRLDVGLDPPPALPTSAAAATPAPATPPVEEPTPVAVAPTPTPSPKASTVHDSSSTIPPVEEPKAGSD